MCIKTKYNSIVNTYMPSKNLFLTINLTFVNWYNWTALLRKVW